MRFDMLRTRGRALANVRKVALLSLILTSGALAASAQNGSSFFSPGNLVISRTVYDNNPNNVKVGEILPPNCQATQGGCAGPATYDGTYPYVWNNAQVDGSFGITSKIVLDQFTVAGSLVNSLELPNMKRIGQPLLGDVLVTSFSSKSEDALNLSLDGQFLTLSTTSPLSMISTSRMPILPEPTMRPTRWAGSPIVRSRSSTPPAR